MILCEISYHLYNLKNVKNTHETKSAKCPKLICNGENGHGNAIDWFIQKMFENIKNISILVYQTK